MMGDRKATFGILIVLLLVFALFPLIESVKAEPNTLVVPEDYATIQEAINHASEGDTVYVRSGKYCNGLVNHYEHISINKSISLIGENRETTIIDGNATGKIVVSIRADNVVLSGFTIQNCGNYPGKNIRVISSANTIINNSILNNGDGFGIYFDGSLGICDNNVISGNYVSNVFYAILLMGAHNNTISNNTVSNTAYGIMLYTRPNNSNVISSNNIRDAGMGINIGGVPVSGGTPQISYGNIVSDNTVLSSERGIALWG